VIGLLYAFSSRAAGCKLAARRRKSQCFSGLRRRTDGGQ
jgi:hypothetical protein